MSGTSAEAGPADVRVLERDRTRQARLAGGAAMALFLCSVGGLIALRTDVKPSVPHERVPVPIRAQAAPPSSPPATVPPAIAALAPHPAKPAVEGGRADMVLVPAGSFVMGEGGADADAAPPHEVEVPAFFIDRTEVTIAAYLHCVTRGPCRAPLPSCEWPGSELGDHPITCVDWSQAHSYCRFIGKRLPTEAEWEKAARGTDERHHPWGNEPPTCQHAAFADRGPEPGSIRGCGRDSSWPVGSFPRGASPYGALDMAGNVWEWTADWYDPEYYRRSPGVSPPGAEEGESRARRGGAWKSLSRYLGAAGRSRMDPARWSDIVGFRCAKSAG